MSLVSIFTRKLGKMFIRTLIRVVEVMFFIGIIGSALVVALTTIDDIKEFLFLKTAVSEQTNDGER